MDYQLIGFVFACIGAVMSALYLVLGFRALQLLKRESRKPSVRD